MKPRTLLSSTLGTLFVTIVGYTYAAGSDSRGQPGREVTPQELGRLLFWDPVLSGARDVACATCHHPDLGYADGRDLPLGTGAVGLGPERVDLSDGLIPVVRRNAPTVLNTAFNGLEERRRRRRGGGGEDGFDTVDPAAAPMFWDHRVRALEGQALEPIRAFDEMRGTAYAEAEAVDSVVARLRAIPEYVALFESAFGTDPAVDAGNLAAAIAAFERSLLAIDSPVDRFRAGEEGALTPEQRRGLEEFDDAGCDRCHSGPMFTDYDLRTLGVRENPKLAEPDPGAGRFRFRTPSLRNVALTAPYMHSGVLATLEDVLRFYDAGRSENPAVADRRRDGERREPRVDGDFRRVDDMSDGEMRAIVAFLEALTDPGFDRTIPERVPSGLPPGGRIGSGGAPRPGT